MDQETEAILEHETDLGLRVWHLLFLCFGSVLGIVIMLCCCFRFRIPRTKQDIEADYHRKKLTKKFRERLDCMNNAEIDEMDLMKGWLKCVNCNYCRFSKVHLSLSSGTRTRRMSLGATKDCGQGK